MVGIDPTVMAMNNRNRSFSLPNEVPYGMMQMQQNVPYGVIPANQIPATMKFNNKNRFILNQYDLSKAERKGWLYVRLDKKDTGWKKRWVVLLDNKLFILRSPDGDPNKEPKLVLAIDLRSTSKVLPDTEDKTRPHNFLVEDPRCGGIHLAAEDQLNVVTWVNVLVRACNNTIRKPLPLIPLKNTDRQDKDTILNSKSIPTITLEDGPKMDNIEPKKKSTSINGILSPNLQSEYVYSVKSDDESSTKIQINGKKGNISNIISPTQSAAAVANGWYRTPAKSATDYSNYRNVQHVSNETRKNMKKKSKLSETPIVETLLKTNKVKSFNPNKIDEEDEFSFSETGMMSFLSNKSDHSTGAKKAYMGMNGLGSPVLFNKRSSVASSYLSGYNSGYNSGYTSGMNSQLTPLEMMERRGNGSFITNNHHKKVSTK